MSGLVLFQRRARLIVTRVVLPFAVETGELLGRHTGDVEMLKETRGEFIFTAVSFPFTFLCFRCVHHALENETW